MDFYAVLDAVIELVRTRGRVSYPALARQFGLDDAGLAALRAELLYSHSDDIRADGHGLLWTSSDPSDAERRQLTVLFCDLVDSTPLSVQIDPEDLRDVMRAYYETCGKVIARFDGHIAQYLGDGLLVFFGYPQAHEDDAVRAVRAGLGIVEAVGRLNVALGQDHGVALSVRLGCHTGLVVVGEVVSTARHEIMALGDTLNIAARLQGVAAPNTLVIGALTHHLLGGLFSCRSLGAPPLKGVSAALEVFEVLNESTARTRLEAVDSTGLTPLVGRAAEVLLLEQYWDRVAAGTGEAVVITGEAGIGKSRLVLALTEYAAAQAWVIPCRGSPYHQHTAFHPLIDLFERIVLKFDRGISGADKLRRLEGFLAQTGLLLEEAVPDLCTLLSIPLPEGGPVSQLPPEQQKQRTMSTLLELIRRKAAVQPVLFVVEDLHWVDPTTIDFLGLLLDQVSGARVLAVFTHRPDFRSAWTGRSDLTEVPLTRLPPAQAAELTAHVAQGKSLPDEIIEQVVSKTDGVPLFVEELTKMLLESGLLDEHGDHYALPRPLPPLAIPNTLQDSLTARLDRLAPVKSLAQLCATLGREFTYPLLETVSRWRHQDLRDGLEQLVASEFLYQQGVPPEATYRFKHALIQDAAYQSLLKSTRQQYHQRIATTMESAFPETVESQPEILAHHYTEAGLTAQAIAHWQRAGRRALHRSANREAAGHAARGLELLGTLPETRELAEHELSLQLTLGGASGFLTGPQSVERVYARACELARQVGDTLEIFPALSGLAHSKMVLGHMHQARTLSEEFLELARRQDDPLILAVGHSMLAYTAWWQGDFISVRTHSRTSLALYDRQHGAAVVPYDQDHGIVSGYLDALSNWVLGYPTQAIQAMENTLARARDLDNPNSVGITLLFLAQLFQLRREPEPATARAEEALAVSAEHGLPALQLWCLLPRGWAAAYQGDVRAGIADIRESMDRRRSVGMGAVWPWYLALLAEAQGMAGQVDEGLSSLNEALGWVQRNDERLYEAEVHRIRGELLLAQDVPDPGQAERCFHRALTVARARQAKSWELRAATSMARMWLQDGRFDAARALLVPVYEWFTEGFDTADLQDARALVEQLS